MLSPDRSSSRFRKRTRSRSFSPVYRRRRSKSPMSDRKRHFGTREQPKESSTLGVFGLSLYTTDIELEAAFKQFGSLDQCKVVIDNKTSTSRGFAFVTFSNLEDAVKAKTSLSNTEIDGKKIRVDYSITQRAHSPTPGVYMGKPGSVFTRRDGEYRTRRSPSPYNGPRYTFTPSPPRQPRRHRSRSPPERSRHHRFKSPPGLSRHHRSRSPPERSRHHPYRSPPRHSGHYRHRSPPGHTGHHCYRSPPGHLRRHRSRSPHRSAYVRGRSGSRSGPRWRSLSRSRRRSGSWKEYPQ